MDLELYVTKMPSDISPTPLPPPPTPLPPSHNIYICRYVYMFLELSRLLPLVLPQAAHSSPRLSPWAVAMARILLLCRCKYEKF